MFISKEVIDFFIYLVIKLYFNKIDDIKLNNYIFI